MSFETPKDFQKYAQDCVKLAQQPNTPPELRQQLFQMATGLTLARRALIAPISSGIAAGSFPNMMATRFVADFRSRNRVPESQLARSREASISARVMGSAKAVAPVEALPLGFLVMGRHPFGN
jgi:hypothetical protein